jgi:hypothetical protein
MGQGVREIAAKYSQRSVDGRFQFAHRAPGRGSSRPGALLFASPFRGSFP